MWSIGHQHTIHWMETCFDSIVLLCEGKDQEWIRCVCLDRGQSWAPDLNSQECPVRDPSPHVKHCLDFSFVFSALLHAWRNLFSASGIFWWEEGTSQPITISKKWKNSSSALHRKRIWVQALPWFSTCSLGLPVWAQISNLGRPCTQARLVYENIW